MPFTAAHKKRVFSLQTDPIDEARRESVLYGFAFAGMGVIVGLANLVQNIAFALSGESLTQRLRGLAFEAIVRQEIAWFDRPENETGALCAK